MSFDSMTCRNTCLVNSYNYCCNLINFSSDDHLHICLQILDFGLARHTENEMTGYVATRWYRAPEIMLNWMHYRQNGISINSTNKNSTRLYTIKKWYQHTCYDDSDVDINIRAVQTNLWMGDGIQSVHNYVLMDFGFKGPY